MFVKKEITSELQPKSNLLKLKQIGNWKLGISSMKGFVDVDVFYVRIFEFSTFPFL